MSVLTTLSNKAASGSLIFAVVLGFLYGDAILADETADAKARWAAAGITDYSFTLTQRVMWGATSIVLIEVREGKLVSASHIIKRTNPVPDHEATGDSGQRKTIDDLFVDINNRDDLVEATFNAELGYPVNMYYQNPDFEDAVDQLEIRDFTVLSDAD